MIALIAHFGNFSVPTYKWYQTIALPFRQISPPNRLVYIIVECVGHYQKFASSFTDLSRCYLSSKLEGTISMAYRVQFGTGFHQRSSIKKVNPAQIAIIDRDLHTVPAVVSGLYKFFKWMNLLFVYLHLKSKRGSIFLKPTDLHGPLSLQPHDHNNQGLTERLRWNVEIRDATGLHTSVSLRRENTAVMLFWFSSFLIEGSNQEKGSLLKIQKNDVHMS